MRAAPTPGGGARPCGAAPRREFLPVLGAAGAPRPRPPVVQPLLVGVLRSGAVVAPTSRVDLLVIGVGTVVRRRFGI